MPEWTPTSWRSKVSLQMATYNDQQEKFTQVMDKLNKVPPLVQPNECEQLKKLLAECGRGERFMIQGGDCAERFVDCEEERIAAQLMVLVQMGCIMEQRTGKKSLKIARIAGQYGKPRTKPTEMVEGVGEVYSFKGDNINGYEIKDRKWDAGRLLDGYWHSCATLNYLRSLRMSGDLSQLLELDVGFMKGSEGYTAAVETAAGIKKSYASTEAEKNASEFFTAHEAMQLDLEEALTRKSGSKYYNLSAHLVWIGDRTRQLDGGHVEYFRGIANPIGVKIGPTMEAKDLAPLLNILNPNKEEGKVMLITRYGSGKVAEMLPAHIKAVQESGIPVVWQCDGVHGNTVTAKSVNLKTRMLDDIVSECVSAMQIHKQCGSVLGGIHIELTGQQGVTECLGGSGFCKTEDMLTKRYETYCDPRLNYEQALEAAFLVADKATNGK